MHSESKVKMPLCRFYCKCHRLPLALSHSVSEASLAGPCDIPVLCIKDPDGLVNGTWVGG